MCKWKFSRFGKVFGSMDVGGDLSNHDKNFVHVLLLYLFTYCLLTMTLFLFASISSLVAKHFENWPSLNSTPTPSSTVPPALNPILGGFSYTKWTSIRGPSVKKMNLIMTSSAWEHSVKEMNLIMTTSAWGIIKKN